jgi:hypothetical protein
MEYHTFDPELYKLKFISRGDASLSKTSGSAVPNVPLLPQIFLRKPSPAKIFAGAHRASLD